MTFDLRHWHHLNAHTEPSLQRRWVKLQRRWSGPCEWCARGEIGALGALEPDEGYYVKPATAAALLQVSVQGVYALRRRGELRSIGLTHTEYARAREAAGWGSASGWGPGVWFERQQVEELIARERKAA